MKSSSVLLSLLVLAAGCASHSSRVSPAAAVALPPRLDSYFEDYCDYTGNLGIGFDPAHTYDYRFRQHLKRTQDPELKRLFVLQHLYRDVDIGLRDFQAGIVITGQSSSRSLTAAEWQETRRRIEEQIDDLAAYSGFTNFARVSDDPFRASDPSLDKDWIAELRGQLRGITNAPAANKTVERTGAPPLSSEHE